MDNAGSEVPAEVAAGIMSAEFLVHAWDLGQALDRPVETSEVLAAYVLGQLRQLAAPGARVSERFGPEVPIADTAPALDRLVAYSGRTPAP
jgi:uncharacterized protein (TIGR03086 family)